MTLPVDDLEQPYDWQNVPHYRGGNRVTRNPLNPPARTGRSIPLKSPIRGASKRLVAGTTRVASGGSADNGYWNLVAGACFLLFFLYIVAHNELQAWANILLWSPSPPVQVGSSSTTAGSQALGGNSAGGATPAGVTSLTPGGTPQLPGALMWPSNFLNNGIDGVINQLNRVAGAPTGAVGPGGVLGSGFWNGPVGSMLKRFGYGK
jgi:hypothetical protein